MPTDKEGLLLGGRDTRTTGTLLGRTVTSSASKGAGGEERIIGCEGDRRMEESMAGIGASQGVSQGAGTASGDGVRDVGGSAAGGKLSIVEGGTTADGDVDKDIVNPATVDLGAVAFDSRSDTPGGNFFKSGMKFSNKRGASWIHSEVAKGRRTLQTAGSISINSA